MVEPLKVFLERLLFGTSLEDKLYFPNEISFDDNFTPIKTLPDFPGRPDFLKPHKGVSPNFPSIHELDDDKKRGELLHFFANHELMAIELMALALLKFNETPVAFKRGVIKAIREEQKHLSLYRARMQELGVSLGDVPVNSFFWDSMSQMHSPLDYVAQLSLTFEQANLDFAYFYEQTFLQIQDHKSAVVMREILLDEIGHVGLGVVWLNRWKNKDESDWQAYLRLLPYPITPARGKGKVYYDFLRKKTGLSDEFVEGMRLFSFSKGRVPDVLIYNPDCEIDNGTQGAYQKSRLYEQMEADLGLVMTYFSVASDIVALKKIPSNHFLKTMQEAGVLLPQYMQVSSWDVLPKAIGERKVRGFLPWGWSRRLYDWESTFADCQRNLSYRPREIKPFFQSKAHSLSLLEEYSRLQKITGRYREWQGVRCSTFAEVESAITRIRESIGERVVIRSEYGLAGQGMIRHFEPEMKESHQHWCLQMLETETLLVEPWLERLEDCSCLLDIRDGKVKRVGVTRLLNTFQGQYAGTLIGKPGSIFSPVVKQYLYGEDEGLKALWAFAEYAGEQYSRDGYCGPLCIDAFFYYYHDEVRLRPCVEINARFSMGRVALEIARHVLIGKISLYCLMSKKDIERMNLGSFEQLSTLLQEKYPLCKSDKGGLWVSGAYCVTDPSNAEIILAVFFVGSSVEECRDFFTFLKGKPWFDGENAPV